jgi:hypothetical protein
MKKIYISILVALTSCLYAQQKPIVQKIYFETDKSSITEKNTKLLDSLIAHLQSNYVVSAIDIKGYTDETGAVEHNQVLSLKRANSVSLYLKNNGIDSLQINAGGLGINKEIQENPLQRNVTLNIFATPKKDCWVGLGIRNDTINLDNRYFRNIRDYTETASMIESEMFAIDSEGNIIRTAGMIIFELNEEFKRARLQDSQSMVKVCLPVPKGEKFDLEMKIWLITKENRWEQSAINIHYDKDSGEYCCYLPCAVLKDFNGVNIDRNINDQELLVSVATFRDFHLYAVELTRSSFSAITGNRETKWHTFVTPDKLNLPELYFNGRFKKDGKGHVLHFQLKKAKFSGNLTKEARYYLTKKSNYFIDGKEYNKKGFWPWVKRLFVKES